MLSGLATLFLNTTAIILQIIFSTYLTILLLRILFQMFRVDWRNPIVIVIFKFTQPIIRPLQKIIPGVNKINLAAIVIMLILTVIKLSLLVLMSNAALFHLLSLNALGLLVWAFGDITKQLFTILFYATIARVLVSWLIPTQHNAFTAILYELTDPILAPARRIIPPIANIDFSPLIVLFIIKFASLLIATPLIQLGTSIFLR